MLDLLLRQLDDDGIRACATEAFAAAAAHARRAEPGNNHGGIAESMAAIGRRLHGMVLLEHPDVLAIRRRLWARMEAERESR